MMDETADGPEDVDLAAALGAGGVLAQCFAVYVPNKDRNGKEIGNQPRVGPGSHPPAFVHQRRCDCHAAR